MVILNDKKLTKLRGSGETHKYQLGNALMLSPWFQEDSLVPPEVDGVM